VLKDTAAAAARYKLDFGSVAHAVISKSNASVLLIADGEPGQKG
jgi:hypothetical protein